MGETKTPKITAIFVGGAMDDRHYDDLDAAKRLYPEDALVTSQTPKSVQDVFSYTPLTKESFLTNTARLIKNHGEGEILHFVQFGHGEHYYQYPQLILKRELASRSGGGIEGELLPRLFKENLPPPENRPYLAMILGGCYSGGFAKYFLEAEVQPDFFFASSPPSTVGFQGLGGFFSATLESADRNHDGVLTLRERGVYHMNLGNNALSTLFSKRGSPDLDIAGRPAKKPYFPKNPDTVLGRENLKMIIESLRFGEQAVVLSEGTDSAAVQTREWFEKEAMDGDGFYSFLKIKGEGKTTVTLMGPNVRYEGMPLEPFSPIGDQVPKILATANHIEALTDWRDIHPNAFIANTSTDYLRFSIDFTRRERSQKIEEQFHSEDPKDWLNGLRLAKLLQSYEDFPLSKYSELFDRMQKKGEKIAPEILTALTDVLSYYHATEAVRIRTAVIRYGLKTYGHEFTRKLHSYGTADQLQISAFNDLRTGDDVAKINALGMLEIASHEISIGVDQHELLLSLLSPEKSSVEVRHAVAGFLSGQYGQIANNRLPQYMEYFRKEPDGTVKATLLNMLAKYIKEKPVRDLEVRDALISGLETAPETTLDKAKKNFLSLLNDYQERKTQLREKKNKKHLRSETFLAPFARFSFMARGEKERWTGGMGGGVGGIFKKSVWTDGKNVLSFGLQPSLDLNLHWKHDWATLIGSAGPLIDWALPPTHEWSDHHPHLTLISGYAARYIPFRDSKDIAHGGMVELNIIMDHSPSSHRPEPKIGPFIRYFIFPGEDDHIFIFGAKYIFIP